MHVLKSTKFGVVFLAFLHQVLAVTVDVAIVGGGLAGLSAAKYLIAAGKSVLVLEARDRVGGRVLNDNVTGGGITEVGAEFVGPTQDRVLALIDELGLSLYTTYEDGGNVLWYQGNRSIYQLADTGGIPGVDMDGIIQGAEALAILDGIAAEVDVEAPWTHPQAEELDAQTWSSWLDVNTPLASARFLLNLASTSIFSADPGELSLFYVIAYTAAAGNETLAGTVERMIATDDGAQQWRVEGGTQLIAIELAAKLGSSVISLNSPVRSITQVGDLYEVVSDSTTVTATSVVVAMSPPLAARISYSPPLPAIRDQLTQRMPMGSIGKAVAIYDTPFWRALNLSGQAVSDVGYGRATFDSSPQDASFGALMAFLEADDVRYLDGLSIDEVQTLVLEDFVRYFGDEAAAPRQFILQRWDLEEWSRGGPVAFSPPGVLTKYGPALKAPVGGIHFAGTESSDYWVGYMDGAIRSGERVAKEILAGG